MMIGVNHRLLVFLFILVISICTAFGLNRLQIDTGFRSLIPETDPNIAIYNRIVGEFGSDNRSLVYVRDPQLWTPTKLAALEELHYALDGLDFVDRVDDLFSLRNVQGSDGKVNADLFLTEAPEDQETANQSRKNALNNPLIVGNLLSPDGNATAFLVSIGKDYNEDQFDLDVNDGLERIINRFKSTFGEVFQLGSTRVNAEVKMIMLKDLKLIAPISALVLIATIFFFLRSWFAALLPILTSALSILWTFGIMGWLGIPLNILSAMIPSLIVVIGSTEDIHMISSYLYGVSRTKKLRRAFATCFMMKHMGAPLILTIFTTMLGFFSNIFSNIGLIQEFAIASTIAILTNGIITILLVPMVLHLIGPKRTSVYKGKDPVTGMPELFVRLFSYANSRFPKAVIVMTLILCIFFLYQASKVYVTNDPLSYFHKDLSLVQETDEVHNNLSGIKVFFITLESEQEKAFLEPENINKLVTIQKFLKKQEIFDSSISLADHLFLVNREFHGGNPEFFKTPESRKLVAQYLLFFHRRDLKSYVSRDFRRANIVVRHNVRDSHTLNKYINELREVVTNVVGMRMKSSIVGKDLMINAATKEVMIGQVKSLGIVLVVIFLIMLFMFTSIKGGLIALIPNLIPIILMFGLMGLLKIPLNPGTAMVAVIAIGIAIDATIHLLSSYNDHCRHTPNYETAVHLTVKEIATPMVATSLALTAGFCVLLKSNFTVIAQFGALSAATMIFALFANLLITPIILSKTRLIGLFQIFAVKMCKEVLGKSPLFEGMTDYQIRKAILISELHKFNYGDVLLKQGTYGRSMYIILSGKVEIVRQCNGGQRCLAVMNAGDIYGELSYLVETRRTADVIAITQVEALRFDYQKLNKDLQSFPDIIAKLNLNIGTIMSKRMANLMNKLDPQVKKG